MLFPRLVLHREDFPAAERWILRSWRMTQYRGPGSCSPPVSQSPSPSPRFSSGDRRESSEPRVSGYEQNFVSWPFERVPLSQRATPLLGIQKPCHLYSWMLYGHLFPTLVLWPVSV